MATTKVQSEHIAINAISGTIIADNAITSVHIAQNAILTKHIDDGQVGTSQLAADAVTGAKLADSSVVTANIQDDQVTGDKLADNITIAGTLGVTGAITGTLTGTATGLAGTPNIAVGTLSTTGALTLGDYIEKTSGNLTLDVAGNIILDADGAIWNFKDGGTEIFQINSGSQNANLKSTVQDKDIRLQGNDGGSTITALTLDMSEAGAANFNSTISVGGTSSRTLGPITGSYGTLQVSGSGGGGYEGLAIDGRVVLMHDGGNITGLYNDVDDEWLFRADFNGESKLYYNGSEKLATASDGVDLTGGTDLYVDLFADSGTSQGSGSLRFLTDASSAEQTVAGIVMQQETGTTRKGEMLFQVADNGTPSTAIKIFNNKNVQFATGMTFGGDTAAANLLDDYEEGTFTPSYTVAGGGSAGSVTGTNTGFYTKVGRMVTVAVQSHYVSTSGTVPTWYLMTLPFAAGQLGGQAGNGSGQEVAQTGKSMFISVGNNASTAVIKATDGAAPPANAWFNFGFTYQTA